MGDGKDSTFEREREIFFAALEKKTTGSRAAYLQETCGDDAAMLGRVREMLENHAGDETETFLTPRDIPQLPGALMEGEGDMVGNYKLVEKLGEGGFGVVWMAEQEEPVKRKVALKLIKPGMDSAEVIARFGAERQALAVMDHPNIAKVFDAGATESGRPYFVMELADGVAITEFCDREKLTTKARLELFAVVCGAVQHAHQKAVIHRDLKPSNILVVEGDDGPVPKVIDFGIANAIGEEAGAQTAFTAHGQLVGTPQYMSPEQAGMGASADIDTRSDVYSLGVVLYELLAGSPPFDAETLRSAGFEGMCRIIREDEPMRPSIRLGTASGEDSTRITGTRGMETQKLSRQVRGELDWIVMKAIEKDRARRYETANGVAADIGRYLNDEPVQAAAPSAAYRFKKFARNKAVLGTVALVASVLVAATGVSVWQAVEAHSANSQLTIEKNQNAELAEQNRLRGEELAATLSRTRIALAERQRHVGNIGNAEKLLRACPPEHRKWEWYVLRGLCTTDVVTFKDGNTKDEGLAISPDGEWVAYPKAVGIVLRRADGSKPERYIEIPRGTLEDIEFSPDGKLLAYVTNLGFRGTVWLWDVSEGKLARELKGGSAGTGFHLVFADRGSRVVLAGGDTIHTWETASGRLVSEISDKGVQIAGIKVTGDGRRIISVEGRRPGAGAALTELMKRTPSEIVIRDAATGKVQRRNTLSTSYIRAVAFSPDDRFCAFPNGTNIEVWDVNTGELAHSLRGHQQAIDALVFNAEGSLLVSGGRDRSVRVWDIDAAAEMRVLQGHEMAVRHVDCKSNGDLIASITTGGEVKMWGKFSQKEETINSTVSSTDGSRAVGMYSDRERGTSEIRIWKSAEPESPLLSLEFPSPEFPGSLLGCDISPSGERLAVVLSRFPSDNDRIAKPDSRIWILDTETGRPVRSLKFDFGNSIANGMPYGNLLFSPDGSRVTATVGIHVFVWDTDHGDLLMHGELPRLSVTSLEWHPDPSSRQLLLGCQDGSLRLWDADRNKEILKFGNHESSVATVTFSPDGRMLASGSDDNEAKIWSAASGALLHSLTGHAASVFDVQFSAPSGDRLATFGGDGTLRFWDSSNGEEIVSLPLQHVTPHVMRDAHKLAAMTQSGESPEQDSLAEIAQVDSATGVR